MVQSFDWTALQSFLAVVRAGRLTVAARQLGIDHSTLSRRIAGLEKSLQARLFDRHVTGYSLTTEGERLLASAQVMESVALTAVTEIGGSSLQVAGTVRIGAPEGFGTVFLAPRLGGLGQLHDDLAIQLLTAASVVSLAQREADIAIGWTRPREGRLHARKLTDYELGLYGSRGYVAASAPIRDRADLARHRFIGYNEETAPCPELDHLPSVCPDVRPAFTSSSLTAQVNATVAGGGLCVLPCFVASPLPQLERVLAASVSLTGSFWLMVHADTRDLARVRVVADFVAREVKLARTLFIPEPAATRGRAHAAPRTAVCATASVAAPGR